MAEIEIGAAAPEYVADVARAVLAVDHLQFRTTEVGAIVIGWLRAAHDQILAAAELTAAGHGTAAAPNVRLVFEVAIRLNWLRGLGDRAAGLRAQFEEENKLLSKHPGHLARMGLPVDTEGLVVPDPADLSSFGPLDESLAGAARAVSNAASASRFAGGYYHAWYASTQYTHATMRMARAYAPRSSFGLFTTPAQPDDWADRLHAMSLMLCVVAADLLMEEGLEGDQALAFFNASLAVDRYEPDRT